MSKQKNILTVLFIVLLCALFYVLTNRVVIKESQLPEEVRVIHSYHEVPGASWDTLSDAEITEGSQIQELMDELEGVYLRVPLPEDFFRNEKKQHELCISWRVNDYRDVDVRSNGRVVINGRPYLRLDDDTNELYQDLLEIIE